MENEQLIESIDYVEKHISKLPKSFIVVFGNKVLPDFTNLKVINSMVIPEIGNSIMLKNGQYEVTHKVINYTQIENHDLDSDERGGEMIYVFVK